MTKKKRNLLILLLAVLILCGCWFYKHYFTGSRSGKVVDAVTGKPVEGAVVCMQWNTGGFMTFGGGCAAFYETRTDEKGRYKIPCLFLSRPFFYERVHNEDVMIYKDGYSGYKVYGDELKPVGRSFGHKNEEQTYHKRRNLVQLFPFKNSDSHQDHINWIETFGIHNWPEHLLEKELKQEMERARKGPD